MLARRGRPASRASRGLRRRRAVGIVQHVDAPRPKDRAPARAASRAGEEKRGEEKRATTHRAPYARANEHAERPKTKSAPMRAREPAAGDVHAPSATLLAAAADAECRARRGIDDAFDGRPGAVDVFPPVAACAASPDSRARPRAFARAGRSSSAGCATWRWPSPAASHRADCVATVAVVDAADRPGANWAARPRSRSGGAVPRVPAGPSTPRGALPTARGLGRARPIRRADVRVQARHDVVRRRPPTARSARVGDAQGSSRCRGTGSPTRCASGRARRAPGHVAKRLGPRERSERDGVGVGVSPLR